MHDQILSDENREAIRRALDRDKFEYHRWMDKFAESDVRHPKVVGWLAKAEAEIAARRAMSPKVRAAFAKALAATEGKLQAWSGELVGVEVGAANKLFKALNQQIGAYTSILQDIDLMPGKLERLVDRIKSADHISSWVPAEMARSDWNFLSSCFRAATFDVEQIKRNGESVAEIEETVRRAIANGQVSKIPNPPARERQDSQPVIVYPTAGFDPRAPKRVRE